MDSAKLLELTTAFSPAGLIDGFIDMAPYIIGVIGIIIAVSLVRWGFKKVKGLLTKGV